MPELPDKVMAKHCVAGMLTSLAKFEDAEARFSRLMARFQARYEDPEQLDEAVRHSKAIRKAQSDAAYYRDRAGMYAAAYGVFDREATRG